MYTATSWQTPNLRPHVFLHATFDCVVFEKEIREKCICFYPAELCLIHIGTLEQTGEFKSYFKNINNIELMYKLQILI